MSERIPLLKDLTKPPRAGRTWLYRWADYVELRCLVHPDGRFSRDNLAEALSEDVANDSGSDDSNDDEAEFDAQPDAAALGAPGDDAREQFSSRCFRQLRWRSDAFGADWPFELDPTTTELRMCPGARSASHILYLQLLLSASLAYCPNKRRRDLTGPFESLSLSVFKRLMPADAEVHAFGAGNSSRYTGHLYERLQRLANDLRGKLSLTREHFSNHNAGDGGLDLVAWHPLGDQRDRIPAALAQCGCTADGWPSKMLEASPDRLAGNLHVPAEWATYYFMPLDLADDFSGQIDWQSKSDMGRAIVIDRLRFMRLADADAMHSAGVLQTAVVEEAAALGVS